MFRGMEYVYEVYREKSFSKAARNLYISQPALSAAVRRVEEELNSPIFDRSRNPVGLTECGEHYIVAVEKIMEVQNNFKNYMADFQQLKTGNLAVGGSNLFSSYVLPPLMAEFTKRYPKIRIHLLEENSENLRQRLLEGHLDLVIDNYDYGEQILSRQLYSREHLLLAVPRGFSANRGKDAWQISAEQIKDGTFLQEAIAPVDLKWFEKEPFIFLKANNDTNVRAWKLCQHAGVRPDVLLQLDQQMTSYNVTCSGMGISFISDTLVRCVQPHPDVIFYKLTGEETERSVHFYWKRGKYMTYAMKAFLQMIIE